MEVLKCMRFMLTVLGYPMGVTVIQLNQHSRTQYVYSGERVLQIYLKEI